MVETFLPPLTPLKTAVLFLVFNRLDTTKQVFEAIRLAKPLRLYIASDGFRENRVDEKKKVDAVRNYIISNVDWECEVKTLFRDHNLGCKYAVSGAIDWFFENEEMGIILEDDCLPSQSFFWFCEELLEMYKDDMRVGQISGDNFQDGVKRGDADYYFSIYSHIWGWASWANRWENYDARMNKFSNSKFIIDQFEDKSECRYWLDIFKIMKKQKVDTWDYQWVFTLWYHKQLTILPNKNLVKNIGFGVDATHTKKNNNFSEIDLFEMELIKHPTPIFPNKDADNFTSQRMFKKKNLVGRIASKVKRIVFLKKRV